jgi:small subunit ribosomal protein S21
MVAAANWVLNLAQTEWNAGTGIITKIGRCFLMALVIVEEGESIESALKRFRKKVQREAIMKEIKKHSVHYKRGEKRRMKEAQARKRMRRRLRRQNRIEF